MRRETKASPLALHVMSLTDTNGLVYSMRVGGISPLSCSLLICVFIHACSRLGVRIRGSACRLPVSFGS